MCNSVCTPLYCIGIRVVEGGGEDITRIRRGGGRGEGGMG